MNTLFLMFTSKCVKSHFCSITYSTVVEIFFRYWGKLTWLHTMFLVFVLLGFDAGFFLLLFQPLWSASTSLLNLILFLGTHYNKCNIHRHRNYFCFVKISTLTSEKHVFEMQDHVQYHCSLCSSNNTHFSSV